MKTKSFFTAILIFSAGAMSAQKEAPVIKSSGEQAANVMSDFIMNIKAPIDPDFNVVDDDFVKRIRDAHSYSNQWLDKELYANCSKDFFYASQISENPSDSALLFSCGNNKELFVKKGEEWKIRKLKVTDANVSWRQIHVGMTSPEVFKMLKKKTNKKVGNGYIWISSADGKSHFEFTFVGDKLVSMMY